MIDELVVGQDFHWNFLVKVTRILFFFFFSLARLTESRSFGYGLEDSISLHKLVVKVA